MKKGLAYAVIAVLLVAAVALGALYFTNNNAKTKQIDALTADVADKAGQIDALAADVAEKAGRIETLNQDLSDRDGQIGDLQQVIADQEEQITGLQSGIEEKDEALEASVKASEETQAAFEKEISDLQEQVKTAQEEKDQVRFDLEKKAAAYILQQEKDKDNASETEEAKEPAADTLLATVNGKEIRENDEELQKKVADLQSQVGASTEQLDRIIRMAAMQQVMQEVMLDEKNAAAGEENTAAFLKETQDYWDQVVKSYMQQLTGVNDASSEEDRIAACVEALKYIETNYQYTEEKYLHDAMKSNAYRMILEELKADNPGLEATEEEILQAYSNYADQQKAQIGDSVTLYEMYKTYYGQEFYYIPEGYRGITHILLDVDQELLDQWNDLTARYQAARNAEATAAEESGEAGEAAEGEPAATEEPVTAEMVEAARQAILDSKKEKIDEIMAKLQDGAAFEDLIAEYGTDPGMSGDNLKNGYMIHKDSITYISEFTNAAAALEKVGDVSDPVVSKFGIHILYYLRDVPAGLVDMTDEVREKMRSEIEEDRLSLAFSEYFDKWMEGAVAWTEEGQAWKYDQSVVDAYLTSGQSGETQPADTEAENEEAAESEEEEAAEPVDEEAAEADEGSH